MTETHKQQLIKRYAALHGGDPADIELTEMPDGRHAFHHKDVQAEDVRTDRMVWRWPEHDTKG